MLTFFLSRESLWTWLTRQHSKLQGSRFLVVMSGPSFISLEKVFCCCFILVVFYSWHFLTWTCFTLDLFLLLVCFILDMFFLEIFLSLTCLLLPPSWDQKEPSRTNLLNCTVLHCSAQHLYAPNFTAVQCSVLLCSALYSSMLHYTALNCIELHCTYSYS